ncbi:PIG-L family deacetylase [Nonomuraea sp. NPDC050310]|uniref:PIG-L family deacetylase n=1 Tax=unclassified Nonomuraea TaxID=2593643 RepID=UPI0034026925
MRRFVASACLGGLAAALCVVTICPRRPDTAHALVRPPAAGERFVQVVAHADDDLLFMSPDLFGAVAGGAPTTTVYLTAGESAAGIDDRRDALEYARQREEGVRAAYAYLARKPNRWRRQLLELPGLRAWWDVLLGRPEVGLVFVGLPDGGDPRAEGGRDALHRLWTDDACVRPVTGGPCVGRRKLVVALRGLLTRLRPTVLRTLDAGAVGPHQDHRDHVSSAKLAIAAARGLDVRVRSYRGYSMTRLPANLDPRLAEVKRQVFEVYRKHDYRAVPGWRSRAWTERMYHVQAR